ncbi:mandelate racemase/muconate lactonizing enzyme family protein [Rhodopirellula sallentina]|uniref:Mandelate racemase/muconate lactonizing protein n=1 Tax=Rhodopirellula sallentina SM41 TaxID=1263870 RepID=M5U5X3_9BACT|nr:mandelate racemase/muconate lactonizing enzyme family protein [Rhodopirellula sallentina]EMI56850.1 Mandelate racemase/muconate lactonizing protein [Rhodopirellula sallentina SM41]
MKIEKVETELYHVPLAKPVVDAIHGVQREFSLIVVKITTDDGATGMGYTYSVGKVGGTSIATLVKDNLVPLLIGEDPRRIEQLWNKMWWALHYVGRSGIAVFALSAVDTALWDLKARMANEPMWRFLGGHDNKAEAYGGGIDFDMTIPQLLDQTQGFLDAGIRAIKIKIGRESIAQECERIAAIREFIGPDKKLMVDVNMKWSVEQALRAVRAFEKYDLYWIEEPTIPDDIEGHRRIETEGPIPVATGENLHSIYEFKEMISRGGVSFPDADISNLGGITALMKVAHIAEAYNRNLTTHGIQEMHVSCLAAIPNASLLEIHAFRLDDFLVHQLEIRDGYAYASDRPGHGVEIDWEKIAAHRVAFSEECVMAPTY